MTIRFYYSFRSPYAWIAALRLKAALGDGFSRIERIPYWEPDATSQAALASRRVEFPYRAMSRERHLYILEDVKRVAADLGITPKWPTDPPQPWWEPPHLAAIAAQARGCGEEFFWAVYRARWLEGKDICAFAVLEAIARGCGPGADTIAGVAGDPDLREKGIEALARAARDRAFGVPFFVVDRHRYWGQDRVDDMLRRHRNAFFPHLLAEA